MKQKRILIYAAKLITAAALLGGLIVLWAFAAFMLSDGGLLNSHFSPVAVFLMVIISIVMLAGYFAFALWLSKLGKEKATGGKGSFFNRFGKPILTLVLPAVGVIVLVSARGSIRLAVARAQARNYVNKADVQLEYGYENGSGIMGTSLSRNTVLVDMSLERVTFIFNSGNDQMLSYRLKHTKKDVPEGKELQYRFDIKQERAELTTYYTPDDSSDKGARFTDGVSLKMSDGSVWYADIDHEYLGFQNALTADILEREQNAEEVIPYGNVKLPCYCAGYDYSTLFVNLENKSLSVLYENKGSALIADIDLHLVVNTADFKDAEVQQMFELYNGGILYACHDPAFNDERTTSFVYVSPLGDYFTSSSDDWGYYGFT